LIALESEVVGAGEEEEGRGYMAPKEGILRLSPLLSPSLPLSERFCAADAKLAPFLFSISLYIRLSISLGAGEGNCGNLVAGDGETNGVFPAWTRRGRGGRAAAQGSSWFFR